MARMASKKKTQPKSNTNLPFVLLGIGLVLMIAAAIWLLGSGGAPSLPAQERVSLSDAKAAFDAKTAVFLDVRGEDQFAASHIPGAVNIPEQLLPGRFGELPKNQWIITYCT